MSDYGNLTEIKALLQMAIRTIEQEQAIATRKQQEIDHLLGVLEGANNTAKRRGAERDEFKAKFEAEHDAYVDLFNQLSGREAEVIRLEERIKMLEDALKLADEMNDYALAKFDWGKSFLDGKAFDLLNRAPIAVKQALAAKDCPCYRNNELGCPIHGPIAAKEPTDSMKGFTGGLKDQLAAQIVTLDAQVADLLRENAELRANNARLREGLERAARGYQAYAGSTAMWRELRGILSEKPDESLASKESHA